MSIVLGINSLSGESCLVNGLLYFSLALGVVKLTTLVLSYSAMLLDLFVLPPVNFKKYGANTGKWAVVTGSSDGIGKEYAVQLAKKGFNIFLISRTQSKLDALSEEISSKYKVETKSLAIDFASDKPSNYELMSQVIKSLPVTILINNVGQSHSIPVPFAETEEQELRNIITINNTATLRTTQIIIPYIQDTLKANKGTRGLILTMGSFGGLLPTPYLATYSGSKAFLQSWSAALAGELSPQGIDVELVISYLVTSAMSKIRRASMTIPSPKVFVASTLRSVGRRCGAQDRFATVTPFWAHALMQWWIENTVGVYSKVANTLNLKMHQDIRKRALKKQARLQKQE
ncbi:CYFA0S30e01090g1_1 [Cyberlindnera fabianii]|uniref:Very-long-chain 3-oxoacyl-CoA reductase n=1 Tax=Cyberlindnera fabianii TaxID=36022 RepID=A0A061BD39_CYBFA|nr:CYFA0S30e01090g1_1 [Cyberlindnera fabianii]